MSEKLIILDRKLIIFLLKKSVFIKYQTKVQFKINKLEAY